MKSREIPAFIQNHSPYMSHAHPYHHRTRIRNLPSFHLRPFKHQPILPSQFAASWGQKGGGFHPHCRNPRFASSLELWNTFAQKHFWANHWFNAVVKLHQRSELVHHQAIVRVHCREIRQLRAIPLFSASVHPVALQPGLLQFHGIFSILKMFVVIVVANFSVIWMFGPPPGTWNSFTWNLQNSATAALKNCFFLWRHEQKGRWHQTRSAGNQRWRDTDRRRSRSNRRGRGRRGGQGDGMDAIGTGT